MGVPELKQYVAYTIPFKYLPKNHINIEQLYDRRFLWMKVEWMDCLLCHQTPSDFVREQIKSGETTDFPEKDLTRLDECVTIASESHMHTAERLTFLLFELTKSMDSRFRNHFLKWIDCHEWLIKEVEARHERKAGKPKSESGPNGPA